jgi:hypothetical protein
MSSFLGDPSFGIHLGGLIPVLVMLPNIAWMLLPKSTVDQPKPVPLILTIVENVGRFAVLILPFFYSLELNRDYSIPVIIAAGLALALYYAAWMRYFTHGRTPELFRAPLLGIPLPLALAPVTFLLFSSYLLNSWPMLIAALIFGFGHIWVSALSL